LSVKFKNKNEWELEEGLADTWKVSFPDVDVEAELRKAAAWAGANKPKKNWQRFLVNWLSSSQSRILERRVKETFPAKQKPVSEMPTYNYSMFKERWGNLGDDFVERVIAEATPNPIRFFKGFLRSKGLLRQRRPDLWEKVACGLAELIGKDKARELWKDPPEILEDMNEIV